MGFLNVFSACLLGNWGRSNADAFSVVTDKAPQLPSTRNLETLAPKKEQELPPPRVASGPQCLRVRVENHTEFSFGYISVMSRNGKSAVLIAELNPCNGVSGEPFVHCSSGTHVGADNTFDVHLSPTMRFPAKCFPLSPIARASEAVDTRGRAAHEALKKHRYSPSVSHLGQVCFEHGTQSEVLIELKHNDEDDAEKTTELQGHWGVRNIQCRITTKPLDSQGATSEREKTIPVIFQ